VCRPQQADALRALYDSIKKSDEFRYLIVYPTYKHASLKGLWSDIKIEVQYKNQKGLERGGYFVP